MTYSTLGVGKISPLKAICEMFSNLGITKLAHVVSCKFHAFKFIK